ncbi:MAG TPA: hypothetical protein VES67_03415 [Vicinamibacterales bacterium]|nr:hypothetical protein [Vicinamibacterales bacterium]
MAATLTRPEGLMVTAVLMVLSLVLSLGEYRQRLSYLVVAAACWGILLALFFAWRYSYFGYLLPNTFYAKTGGGLEQIKRGALTSALFAAQFVGPLVPWALVAFWETGMPRFPLRVADVVAGMRRHALVVACLAVTTVYATYIVVIGNDYMAMHRFFVPVLPLIYLAGTVPLALLLPSVNQRSRLMAVAALVAVAASLTLFHSTPLEKYFVAKLEHQHGNFQGVQIARWWAVRMALLAEFFDGYIQSPEESLGTNAIGIIGYVGDFKTYDANGLVDVDIAHASISPSQLARQAGHQREDFVRVLTKKPTYVMFGKELTPTSGDIERFVPPDVWPLVQQDYVVRSVWLTDRVNGEAGYFSFFERRDHNRSTAATFPREKASR